MGFAKKSDLSDLLKRIELLEKQIGASPVKDKAKTAKKKAVEEDLVNEARIQHQSICEQNKSVSASIKLVTDDGDNIQIDIAKNQYKKIKKSMQPELKKIFGEEMESCFTNEISVKLTNDALEDKEILTKLIKAVGQENFKKYFEVEQILKPTEKMHEGRFLDPKIKTAVAVAVEAKMIEPYTPSVKE
jgi:predicted transcriptional regulator